MCRLLICCVMKPIKKIHFNHNWPNNKGQHILLFSFLSSFSEMFINIGDEWTNDSQFAAPFIYWLVFNHRPHQIAMRFDATIHFNSTFFLSWSLFSTRFGSSHTELIFDAIKMRRKEMVQMNEVKERGKQLDSMGITIIAWKCP